MTEYQAILEMLNEISEGNALIRESQIALMKVIEQIKDRILIAEEKQELLSSEKEEARVKERKSEITRSLDAVPCKPTDSKEPKTPVKITVEEDIKAEIGIITEKAVQFIVGDQFAWIPKKCIVKPKAFTQGKVVNLELAKWFQEKVEWKQIKEE